jgi:hypothetical protein
MILVPNQARGQSGYEFSVDSRYFGSHRRVDCACGRYRLRADRAVRKARQAGQRPAGASGAAGPRRAGSARAGDSGSAELVARLIHALPLRNASSVPILLLTATLTLQSSGAGTTMNSLAAPDVRAPSVRGRWHFGTCFRPLSPLTVSSKARLGMSGGGGYTAAHHE